MKNWLKRNAGLILSTCLGTWFVYYIDSFSFCLFGEPEFPTEE